MAPSLLTCVTFPLYKLLYGAVSVLGALRSMTFWWPSFKAPPTIGDMEEFHDPRAVWMSPRFAEQPNFYLDDLEAADAAACACESASASAESNEHTP